MRLLQAIDDWVGMLAEVLDPGALHTGMVLGRFDKIHEIGDVCVEAVLKLRVRDPLFLGEGVVCLGEREHVRVDASSEMLEGDPQRPNGRGFGRPSTARRIAAVRAAR